MTLRVIAGDAPSPVAGTIGHRIGGVATSARAAAPTHRDLDRWTDEGGSFDGDADAPVAATAAKR